MTDLNHTQSRVVLVFQSTGTLVFYRYTPYCMLYGVLVHGQQLVAITTKV